MRGARVAILLAAAAYQPNLTAQTVALDGPTCTQEERLKAGDTFSWGSGSPAEYLKMLESRGQENGQPADYRRLYPVCGYHCGWVKEEHLADLVAQIDSQAPCAQTVASSASYVPVGSSFVGQEAPFLIDAFRTGVFPPSLYSKGYYRNREEILRWWQSHREQPSKP